MLQCKHTQFAASIGTKPRIFSIGDDEFEPGEDPAADGVVPCRFKHLLQAFRLASFHYSQNKQTHPSVCNFLFPDDFLGDPYLDGVLNEDWLVTEFRLLSFEDDTGESCFMRFVASFAGTPDVLVLGGFSDFFSSFCLLLACSTF